MGRGEGVSRDSPKLEKNTGPDRGGGGLTKNRRLHIREKMESPSGIENKNKTNQRDSNWI